MEKCSKILLAFHLINSNKTSGEITDKKLETYYLYYRFFHACAECHITVHKLYCTVVQRGKILPDTAPHWVDCLLLYIKIGNQSSFNICTTYITSSFSLYRLTDVRSKTNSLYIETGCDRLISYTINSLPDKKHSRKT